MAQTKLAARSPQSQARAAPRDDWHGKLHIPMSLIPRDQKWEWKTETVLGENHGDNIAEAMMQGWRPVPAEKYPHLVPPQLDDAAPTPKFIRRGGMILMWLPMAKWLDRVDEIADENREQLKGVDKERVADQNRRRPTIPALEPETADVRETRRGPDQPAERFAETGFEEN